MHAQKGESSIFQKLQRHFTEFIPKFCNFPQEHIICTALCLRWLVKAGSAVTSSQWVVFCTLAPDWPSSPLGPASPQSPLLSLVCTTTSNSSSFSLSSQLNKFPCISSQLLLKRPLLDYPTTPHKPCVSKTKSSTPHCHIYFTNDYISAYAAGCFSLDQ